MPKRVVKRGKAKDYQRDAKYFEYYYIRVNNKNHSLNWGGWNYDGNLVVRSDANGNFVMIEDKKYYLIG